MKIQQILRKFFYTTAIKTLAILQFGVSANNNGNGGPVVIETSGGGLYSSPSETNYTSTQCNPSVTHATSGKVLRITPNGNCVNIYGKKDCEGSFIRYVPGRMSNLYSPSGHKWVDDSLVKEPLSIQSVGPCLDKCNPRNWEGVVENSAITVTLFDDENFIGNETTVHIISNDCYVLPLPRRIWESLKIFGNEDDSCVELHSDASCGGEFTQFRPGFPHLHDLWYWGLGGENSALHATAVSRCGSFCNRTIPPIRQVPSEFPAPNIVTYYDFFGYYGNGVNLNLSGGCVNPPTDELERLLSIQTYGQCIIIYGQPDCKEKQGYYTLQTAGMGKEYYIEKLLTLTIPVRPKSLRLCTSDDYIAEVTTEGITMDQSEMSGNVRGGEYNSDEKSGHPIWVIFLLAFCGLLLFVMGALFGAFISKRYERISHGVTNERFNVLYKLQS